MAAERRLPSLDEFAGQSWSAWVERAGPPAEPGSGSELEESGKSGGKKLDAMTLIKEDMNIFGHCPAHDEFYLVVCNHCSQVVKPQAFQKHCERRHGPLSKLYARAAAKCHVAVNGQPVAGGTPGAAKALREKPPGARGRVQPLPERPDKDNNLCLFVPVVNLEKIPSIPKPDGHGIKVPPKAVPTNSKEPVGKPATAAVPKEPPVPAGVGGDSAMPADGPGCKPESAPAPGEKDAGASKPPPRSHKKLARLGSLPAVPAGPEERRRRRAARAQGVRPEQAVRRAQPRHQEDLHPLADLQDPLRSPAPRGAGSGQGL